MTIAARRRRHLIRQRPSAGRRQSSCRPHDLRRPPPFTPAGRDHLRRPTPVILPAVPPRPCHSGPRQPIDPLWNSCTQPSVITITKIMLTTPNIRSPRNRVHRSRYTTMRSDLYLFTQKSKPNSLTNNYDLTLFEPGVEYISIADRLVLSNTWR